MTAEIRGTIKKLVAFLPLFESGEPPTSVRGGYFMMFYDIVAEEFVDRDYQKNMERFGEWEGLKDLEFIRQAGIDDLKTILTAACRSEYWGSCDYSGSVWRDHNDAGTFITALRRLAELERKV